MKVFSVLIAGVGGQGVLLTSRILAEAALACGFDVKQSEVHGMAQRGGSVLSQVRFGKKVLSPVVSPGECDLIIGFEPVETARCLHFLNESGTVIYNTRRIMTLPVSSGMEDYPADVDEKIHSSVKKVRALDGTSLAVAAGDKRSLNIVMLGAAMEFLKLDEKKTLKALEENLPTGALEVNKKAYLAGRDCGQEKGGRP